MKSESAAVLSKERRKKFERDPFGYGIAAHQFLATETRSSGIPDTFLVHPSNLDLREPALWLSAAFALAEAARTVIFNDPKLEMMPEHAHNSIDCQYRGAGLMLLGYSLEVCLKGILIHTCGVDQYSSNERRHKHHKLERLADFVPDIGIKERVILRLLTDYVEWAGRYPDPGGDQAFKVSEVYLAAKKHRVTLADVFALGHRVTSFGVSLAK